jgi:GGDEF domain-containing protein
VQLEFHSLIGAIYLDVGATGIALEHIRDAYEIARDAVGAWDRSVAEYNLARAYARTGDLAQAREFFEQALQTSRSINDGLGVAYAQMRLAELEHQQGNNDIALTLLDKTLPDFRDAAAHPMEAQSLLLKAEILLAEARLASAKGVSDTTQSLINTLHDVGDAVLKRFTDVTQECLRRQDHFGRMGGEEWLLVLFDASENDAELIFSRILNRMNEVEIKGLPRDYRVTFSMGFAEATTDDTFERLYKRADDVLYAAKERGRQRLEIAPLPPAQNG